MANNRAEKSGINAEVQAKASTVIVFSGEHVGDHGLISSGSLHRQIFCHD